MHAFQKVVAFNDERLMVLIYSSNYNGRGMCTESQQSNSLRYLAFEIMNQTKKSSLISFYSKASLFSDPFSFSSVPSGSARLYWNQMETFFQQSQKITDSGSKYYGFKGSFVNARPICTNFGSVTVGTIPFGSSVSGIIE